MLVIAIPIAETREEMPLALTQARLSLALGFPGLLEKGWRLVSDSYSSPFSPPPPLPSFIQQRGFVWRRLVPRGTVEGRRNQSPAAETIAGGSPHTSWDRCLACMLAFLFPVKGQIQFVPSFQVRNMGPSFRVRNTRTVPSLPPHLSNGG